MTGEFSDTQEMFTIMLSKTPKHNITLINTQLRVNTHLLPIQTITLIIKVH